MLKWICRNSTNELSLEVSFC